MLFVCNLVVHDVKEGEKGSQNLVNLFLLKLVRISGFYSLFAAITMFLALSGKMC